MKNHCVVFQDYAVVQLNEVLCKMILNTLYHLREYHPIIDGVGLLRFGFSAEEYLVFVQTSITPYKGHSTNLQALFDSKRDCKGYKELKTRHLQFFNALPNTLQVTSPDTLLT